MSPSKKLTPNLDQRGTKALNLTVLRRIDPAIDEILLTAAHVSLYDFSLDQSEWSRKDVEGSMFVVKRNSMPRFQFIVMNRRNTNNLVENLLEGFEYEVQVPYILYRNAVQEITGVWFYNQNECQEVGNLFGRILNAYCKVQKPEVSSVKSDFEKLEPIPASGVVESTLQPTLSSISAAADAPADSFFNLFNAVSSVGLNASNIVTESKLCDSTSPLISQFPSSLPISVPTCQKQAFPTSSSDCMPVLNIPASGNSRHCSDLANPLSFLIPTSSSSPPISLMGPPVASSLLPVTNPPLLRPPLLQPFPPPTPSPSLTLLPSSGVVTRDNIRDALVRLSQKGDFIDMVYQEIVSSPGHGTS